MSRCLSRRSLAVKTSLLLLPLAYITFRDYIFHLIPQIGMIKVNGHGIVLSIFVLNGQVLGDTIALQYLEDRLVNILSKER